MAKSLREWIDTDVGRVKSASMRWLSECHFFRDPMRPLFIDASYFFAPADGVILYQKVVDPDEAVVDVKGVSYSLRDALREPSFDRRSLVVGIFMTVYDVHVNRIPLAGRLTYKEHEPIRTHNAPMLEVEKTLLDELRVPAQGLEYLHNNQRMVNRIWAPDIGQHYYLLQVADYDIDCILPFDRKQYRYFAQNERFSQIRYGSQVDLVVPLSPRIELSPLVEVGMHVEAGVDRIVRIVRH
ncbi:phosphatidylserine decarboxylase [Polyangium aurulentum]|uniref:phosphatidylserine decarboxylase n=1 Tax=Polyangium aurulentum TaxID=2567896 RepID=UPI0010ADB9D7|nr:phosphatidylserine decarboxylase [Polyangium aurulentum]UQA59037.1 phosphatidylserine decarboxylase [Polyangium aurulentum]